MTVTSRLPFSLDPLIDEARERARRRRSLLALGLAVLVGGAVAAVLAFQSPNGSTTSSPKSNAAPSPTQPPLPPRASSIQVIHESPFGGAMVMGVNNMWQGRVGRIWVLAYAGMYNKNPSAATAAEEAYEPAVALWTEPVNPNADHQYVRLIGVYPAPGSEGSVGITAETANVLKLAGFSPGAKRHSLQFNLVTRTYKK